MNSNQIRRVMRGHSKCFIGVFPADDLVKIALHLRKYKKFKTQPAAFILNTQPSWMGGEHWLAFYLAPLKQRNEPVQVFDSFGRDRRRASFAHTEYFSQFIRTMDKPYQINRQRLQSKTTAVCGYYSCVFILLRCRGIGFAQVLHNFAKYGSTAALRDKRIVRIFKALLWGNMRGKMPHEQEANVAVPFQFQTCKSINNCI